MHIVGPDRKAQIERGTLTTPARRTPLERKHEHIPFGCVLAGVIVALAVILALYWWNPGMFGR